jgi:hypothetical protein
MKGSTNEYPKNYFLIKDNILYLVYEQKEAPLDNWIVKKIIDEQEYGKFGTTFVFRDVDDVVFIDGVFYLKISKRKSNGYFCFSKEKIGTRNDFYIHESAIDQISVRDLYLVQPLYAVEREGVKSKLNNTTATLKYYSIIKKISEMCEESVYVGGDLENSIAVDVFKSIVAILPDRFEVRKYIDARVSVLLEPVFEQSKNFQKIYDNSLRKRSIDNLDYSLSKIRLRSLGQFVEARDRFDFMLSNSSAYSEAAWQNEILELILLIFPKYIKAIKEVQISGKKSRVDIMLFDSLGFIDVIEIKKPIVGGNNVLSKGKYNKKHYIPSHNLSGAIMQTEKYLFELMRDADGQKQEIEKKCQSYLPSGYDVKIVNPVGMVIFGRDNNFTSDERRDFEIIKRKYNHIVDVMTYDDISRRLKNIIEALG